MTIMVRLCVIAGLLATVALPAAAESRDLVVLTGSQFRAIVERETEEGIVFKITQSQPNAQTRRWSEVVRIEYHGMDAGLYRAGMDAMTAGRYEEAATRFQALASSGTREWEGVYGNYHLGESWELAGAYSEAAAAFANLAAAFPQHRFYADALYRQGINLARDGKAAEAKVVIDALLDIRAKNPSAGRGPEFRATAIDAAVKAAAGQMSEAQRLAGRVAFTQRDGDTWFHWGSFWAGFLRERGEYREAAREYQKMLTQVGEDPARRSMLSVGLGVCLAQSGDKTGALFELLKLDVLPYGSPAQRCEAQYWAGRTMVETGTADLGSEDPRVAEFAHGKIRRGRELLQAAANSIASHPSKQQAADFLSTLPNPSARDDAEAGAETATEAPAVVP